VSNAAQLQDWVSGLLRHSFCALDILVLPAFAQAWCADDCAAVRHWSAWLHACRESAELQVETVNSAARWRDCSSSSV